MISEMREISEDKGNQERITEKVALLPCLDQQIKFDETPEKTDDIPGRQLLRQKLEKAWEKTVVIEWRGWHG